MDRDYHWIRFTEEDGSLVSNENLPTYLRCLYWGIEVKAAVMGPNKDEYVGDRMESLVRRLKDKELIDPYE